MTFDRNEEREPTGHTGAVTAAINVFFNFVTLLAAALLVVYGSRARGADAHRSDAGHSYDRDLGRTRAALRPSAEAPRGGREGVMSAESGQRERPAIAAGAVAAVMAGFFVFVVLVATGLLFFYEAIARDATFVKPNTFPAPRLQTRSDGLRDPQIARQQADLEWFRWIDKSRGSFQIPIAQAMKIVSDRGQKAYDPVPGPPPPPKAATQ